MKVKFPNKKLVLLVMLKTPWFTKLNSGRFERRAFQTTSVPDLCRVASRIPVEQISAKSLGEASKKKSMFPL